MVHRLQQDHTTHQCAAATLVQYHYYLHSEAFILTLSECKGTSQLNAAKCF